MRDPRSKVGRTPSVLARVALGSAALVWCGCSVERNYDILNFFFDGVPEPMTSEVVSAPVGPGGQVRSSTPTPGSRHAAYVERRCADCHGDRASFGFQTSGFSDLDDAVCLECHDDVRDAMPYMHGPVEVGVCLICHDPHISQWPALLNAPTPDLCVQCHEPALLDRSAGSPHEDPSRDCLDCHLGHGGSDSGMLRPHDPQPIAEPIEVEPVR